MEKNNKSYIAAVVIIIIIVIGTTLFYRSPNTANKNTIINNLIPRSLSVDLKAQNKSGQNGKAIIRESDGKVSVEVTLTGESASGNEPSHIHAGSCKDLGSISYPLVNIVNGKGTTLLNVSYDELLADLPLAINVHKSPEALGVYVACGDITANSATPVVSTVIYSNGGFSPDTITIRKGDMVRFTNESGERMWVASDPHPVHTDYPGFDEKQGVSTGESYEFTFTETGSWGFHNHLNSGRGGTIIVQ